MIRFVSVHVATPQNAGNAEVPALGILRILTGHDGRRLSGHNVAVIEIPLGFNHEGAGNAYLTSAELRAFADMMDATTD